MHLVEPFVLFKPSLDIQDHEGLFSLIINLIDEIQAMSEYAHQLSTENLGKTFRVRSLLNFSLLVFSG